MQTYQIYARQIGQKVKITAIINHRLVFIRPATDRDDIDFARLMCDTVRYAEESDYISTMPIAGTMVLAKFDFYQRGLVLKKINDTQVAVAFIDFGNVEVCDFRKLKVMPNILNKVDRFATKLSLSGITSDIMDDRALKVLYKYMAQDAELKFDGEFDVTNNMFVGTLKASNTWINQSVNEMNSKFIVVQPTKSICDRVKFFFSLHHTKKKTNKKLQVC